MPKFKVKSITSKSLKVKKPIMSQEAWVLVRGFLLREDKGKKKPRFVGFMRDSRVVAFIRKQAKKDTKKRLVFPRAKKVK